MVNPLTGGIYHSKTNRSNPIELFPNTLNPLYRPLPSTLSVQERYSKILSVGIECQQPEELQPLLAKNRFIYCYDGFEPSGRMHIAQGLMKVINVNKLTEAGCIFVLWVADWFAMLNNKMGSDLRKIRVVGEYFIEIWRAVGMKMSNVKFIWASDFINEHSSSYWPQVMNIGCKYSIDRIKRCSTVMGREESDNLKVSQMMYPLMQCTDIFALDMDICNLGLDQKKVNMLARDYCADTHRTKVPVILSQKMIGGLKQGEQKMSKSTGSAIFMEDSEEEVRKKIKGAFCETGNIKENPCLEYVNHIVFGIFGKFEIFRKQEHGGNIVYNLYEDVEKDFAESKLHPGDLKKGVADALNRILQPVRTHFETDARASELLRLVKQYKKEADAASAAR